MGTGGWLHAGIHYRTCRIGQDNGLSWGHEEKNGRYAIRRSFDSSPAGAYDLQGGAGTGLIHGDRQRIPAGAGIWFSPFCTEGAAGNRRYGLSPCHGCGKEPAPEKDIASTPDGIEDLPACGETEGFQPLFGRSHPGNEKLWDGCITSLGSGRKGRGFPASGKTAGPVHPYGRFSCGNEGPLQ